MPLFLQRGFEERGRDVYERGENSDFLDIPYLKYKHLILLTVSAES